MDRNQAYSLLTKYLHNKNLLKHSLAAEAGMKSIYKYLTPKEKQDEDDENIWGITGLLHDIDYEIAQNTNRLNMHGKLIFESEYEPNSIPDKVAQAIKSHNFEMTNVMPKSVMDWAIYCVDQLTGLIVAGALVHPARNASTSVAGEPGKKSVLRQMDAEYVLNRFGEKSFARGARRESILLCEEKLGIPLKEFISIVLEGMKEISGELGL